MFLFFGCARKEETASINANEQPIQPLIHSLDEGPAKDNNLMARDKNALSGIAHNPFLTEEEEKEFTDLGKAVTIDYLIPSAILYSSANKNKVIINGQILKIGNTIDNKEIIKIEAEEVILKDSLNEYSIKLREVTKQ